MTRILLSSLRDTHNPLEHTTFATASISHGHKKLVRYRMSSPLSLWKAKQDNKKAWEEFRPIFLREVASNLARRLPKTWVCANDLLPTTTELSDLSWRGLLQTWTQIGDRLQGFQVPGYCLLLWKHGWKHYFWCSSISAQANDERLDRLADEATRVTPDSPTQRVLESIQEAIQSNCEEHIKSLEKLKSLVDSAARRAAAKRPSENEAPAATPVATPAAKRLKSSPTASERLEIFSELPDSRKPARAAGCRRDSRKATLLVTLRSERERLNLRSDRILQVFYQRV